MTAIPSVIPQLGEASLKPLQNPKFVPGSDFGTEEYFVWSRCDGATSLRDLVLMVGFGTTRSLEILAKLRGLGAIMLPGESPDDLLSTSTQGSANATNSSEKGVSSAGPPPGEGVGQSSVPDHWTEEDRKALQEDVPVPHEERLRIIEYRYKVDKNDYFTLLGVDAAADKRILKRAYFALSKEFHPDRYFGRDIGPFGPWLASVFRGITTAFRILSNPRKRAEYEAAKRGTQGGSSSASQTKVEHAASLFFEACSHELQRDYPVALKFFAAAIRLDANPRFLKRAAMCALQAGELSVAQEYAKNAVALRGRDGSYLRVLADVHRALGEFDEAKSILGRALALDTGNDTLFAELQSDLRAVSKELDAQ